MKSLLSITVAVICTLFISCGVTPDRKPVPPSGSDEGDMPWNRPSSGEGAGMFGGAMSR